MSTLVRKRVEDKGFFPYLSYLWHGFRKKIERTNKMINKLNDRTMKIYLITTLIDLEGYETNAYAEPFVDFDAAKTFFEKELGYLKDTYGLKPNFEPTDAHFEDDFKVSFSRNENFANVTWRIIEQVATK